MSKYRHKKKEQIRKDSYSLDVSTAQWILPRLKYLYSMKDHEYFGHPVGLEYEEWVEILEKIIFSFEYATKIFDEYCLDKVKRKEMFDRVQEGLQLFAKYYFDLWW